MKKVLINCDQCDKDITVNDGNYEAKWRLKLGQELMRKTTSLTYGMICHPLLENDLYFCDLQCLVNYVSDKFGYIKPQTPEELLQLERERYYQKTQRSV